MTLTDDTIPGATDPSTAGGRLPGVARGGAFLFEPIGTREIFITGEFTDEQRAYAATAEDMTYFARRTARRWAGVAPARERERGRGRAPPRDAAGVHAVHPDPDDRRQDADRAAPGRTDGSWDFS